MASDASSITVSVRVRPFTIREAAQLVKTEDGPMFLGDGSLAAAPPKLSSKGLRSIIKVVDDKCLVFDPPEDSPLQKFSRSVVPQGKRVKDQTFMFDRVFDENTSQSDVYEATTRNLLDSVLDGYNATVFAYGATGCGKTHTITGTSQAPGIIFLTMQELFERIADLHEEKVIEISLSYLEIYNETIRDLLVTSPCTNKQGLMLREDSNQAVSVAGLSSHHPRNVQEVMDMIVRGNELRTISPTAANATSSRSHAVLQINVSQKDRNADINEPHTMATFSIIDLAGSERASATLNRGERLLEGANINKSLLALGGCINALCDPRKRNHVPYRNSKLTRLLKFSLGGNCKTVMIVCVSPSSAHFDETQNTLRYANRAKNIQTKVTRNVYNVNRHVKDFLKKIDEQMALINELKQQQKEHEANAFVKFRKAAEKREAILREGLTRIRAAYDHSAQERQERTNLMKKCRQIERRLSLISAWVAGFDAICEAREEEEPPSNLVVIRKTAQGILTELESSRQHCHQRLNKNNWDRALETALQTGIRQLRDTDSSGDYEEASSLSREAEMLRTTADREAYMSVLEQEKGGDAAIVQVLLQAHFDTIAILSQIMQMSETDAVQAARKMLSKLVTTCTTATSQVVKPDGGLPVTEKFAPTIHGTPKFRKTVNLMAPSPIPALPYSDVADISLAPTVSSPSSPMKSPRRRKLGAAKRFGTSTPSRRSPSKAKRGVRWRDDTEEGTLVEFQATPQPIMATPDDTSDLSAVSQPKFSLSSDVVLSNTDEESPITTPPEMTQESKPRASRFQAGFLLKRSDGSPIGPPPTSAVLNSANWSDSDSNSPLREIEPNRMPYLSPLHSVTNMSSDVTPADSGNSSSEDDVKKTTRPTSSRQSSKDSWSGSIGRLEAKQIRTALKRNSSIGGNGTSGHTMSSAARTQRRRSPTASSAGSPPHSQAPPQFSASQVRRMGGISATSASGAHALLHHHHQDRLGSGSSVLSPRTAPVLKSSASSSSAALAAAMRRTTVADELGRAAALGRTAGARVSSAGGAGSAAAAASRGSLAPGAKNVWR